MENLLTPGVSVLVCTYNGGKILFKTLEHLASQKFKNKLCWEIIIVDNGSTDDTANILKAIAVDLKRIVPVHLVFEPKKGKENAVDRGLKMSAYKYVVICDDDNWLTDSYVETAFNIMESNPSIGLLGGKGIAATNGAVPHWFDLYKQFYAVGDQHYLNGEIRHFWPMYKFIWGAGSVINKSAYLLLVESGFKRILTHQKTGKIARSEDLEFCFAIWLTGYKLWYDENLTYHHYISQDRLTEQYLLKIIKISMPATYYLKPYNIIKFSFPSFYPKKMFWYKNVVQNFYALFEKGSLKNELILTIKCITGKIKLEPMHVMKLILLMQLFASLKLAYRYDINYKRIYQLKKDIDLNLMMEKNK